MAKVAGLTPKQEDTQVYANLIRAIELKDVDPERVRKCEAQTSVAYSDTRDKIDESTMTFSYLDLMRLRLLYEWQFTSSLPDAIVKLANQK